MTTSTTARPTLRELQAEIAEVNTLLGWYEGDRTPGEDLALLHSEASEALEAYRDHGFDDATEVYLGHAAEHPDGLPPLKPEGVGAELADVVIRLLDTVGRWDGPDPYYLDHVIYHVLPFNMPGTFGDVIAHIHHAIALQDFELVLRSVIGAAELAEVDLEREIVRKIAFNRTRGHRHGGKRL